MFKRMDGVKLANRITWGFWVVVLILNYVLYWR